MKRTILAMTALVMLATMTGCETIKGFGRDVQNLGSGLQNGANHTEHASATHTTTTNT